ncbi:MAG: zinc ribbon domain-containing protein [Methanobacterium sp.]
MVNNPNQLICPNCSTQLPKNVRFCNKCGTKIESNPNAKSNEPINDQIESLRESGKDFVQEIGGFFNKGSHNNQTKNICPKCFTKLPADIKYCTKCGTPTEKIQPRVQPRVKPKKTPFSQGIKEGEWVRGSEYELDPIIGYRNQISEISENANNQIKSLNKQIDNEREKYNFLYGLLTKTGDELVKDVEEFLVWIGFSKVVNVDKLIDEEVKQEDLRICDNSIKLLLEAKGTSTLTKDIYITQLVKYISRRRKEWNSFDVNGILIINHQWDIPPLERDNINVFNKEQIEDALENDIGLITTWDLFILIQGLFCNHWEPKVIRELLFNIGIIPKIPTHYKPIGKIFTYIENRNVIGVDLTDSISIGQRVGYKTSNGFLEEDVLSLQIILNNDEVNKAIAGDKIGLKTKFNTDQLFNGLEVYKVT